MTRRCGTPRYPDPVVGSCFWHICHSRSAAEGLPHKLSNYVVELKPHQKAQLPIRHCTCLSDRQCHRSLSKGPAQDAMAHLRSAGVASTSGSDVVWRPSRGRAARGSLRVAAVASSGSHLQAGRRGRGSERASTSSARRLRSTRARAASLAQLYGTGLRDEDVDKPQVCPRPSPRPGFLRLARRHSLPQCLLNTSTMSQSS